MAKSRVSTQLLEKLMLLINRGPVRGEDAWIRELNGVLGAYHTGLAIDLDRSLNAPQLVVTAGGDKGKFAMVMELVEKVAGVIPEPYRIRALAPPRREHIRLVTEEGEFEVGDMFYILRPGMRGVKIRVYVVDASVSEEGLVRVGVLMVENMVGEYVAATLIEKIEVVRGKFGELPEGLEPLFGLRERLEEFGGMS